MVLATMLGATFLASAHLVACGDVKIVKVPSRFCQRGDSCWPSAKELVTLSASLNPEMDRSLHWAGGESPRISAVAFNSPGDQPLFGMNQNLKPLYIEEENAPACSGLSPNDSDFCKQSIRNLPKTDTQPGFVAWPLTTKHVQTLLSFANTHNLCVSVASTGHDFVERNSCKQSLMIRTALLKGIEWDLGATTPSVKVGAGSVFSEVMESGSKQNPSSYVASGWAQTVGVVGWALGGGHGPHGRTHGFGADNLMKIEIVLANGTAVTASSTSHSDLFWALRGGGGSTWGIITSVMFRAHATPDTGFTVMILGYNQSMCGSGKKHLNALLEDYPEWAKKRSSLWSGLALFQPARPFDTDCDASWNGAIKYVYRGDKNDEEFVSAQKNLEDSHAADSVSVVTFPDFWQVVHAAPIAEDYILSTPFPIVASTVGVPSIEVAKEDVDAKFYNALKARMEACKGGDSFLGGVAGYCVSLYHDIPSTDCPEPVADDATSLHPAFRAAMFHVMTSMNEESGLDDWLSLGEASYFSESTYNMPNWQQRYWGKNYDQLLAVKKAYDPEGQFWCHHCVGDVDPTPSPTPTPVPSPTPSGCPGGSLLACIEQCPTSPDSVYNNCCTECGNNCPDSPTPPTPAPTPKPIPAPTPAPSPTPSGCPGGSLLACIEQCPTWSDVLYNDCCTECGNNCLGESVVV